MTSSTALYWLIAVGVFTLAFRFLAKLQLNSKKLVADLNAREGLALDTGLLLGYPSPIFMVFDRQNRKFAVCNVARGESQIYDFSWVLRWDITFREVERTQMGGGTRQINSNGMSVPNFERVTEVKDYAIALQTADIHEPVMRFPMSRKQAEIWCARLNAIFNG
ncbi:membrane protein [Pseudomonas cremoricolorata]|uniref:Membrane protein n=1 Tax=Pseudomonas cremoricolorata TaxID=157783 RepID=A0A089WKX6_9PSED|nr:membrane protein [Pseudomonas cremoricolorata]